MDMADRPATVYCNFCGGNSWERKVMISGPSVYMCNVCLDLSMDLVQQHPEAAETSNYLNREVVAFVLWLTYTGDRP